MDLFRQIRSELMVLELLHYIAGGFADCGALAGGAVEQIHHVVVGAGVAEGVGMWCSAAGRDGCGLVGAPGGHRKLDSCGMCAVN